MRCDFWVTAQKIRAEVARMGKFTQVSRSVGALVT